MLARRVRLRSREIARFFVNGGPLRRREQEIR